MSSPTSQKPLAAVIDRFDQKLIVCKDSPYYTTKVEALASILQLSGFPPSSILYVGDQTADADAARLNAIPFLGVTYGWCFSKSLAEPFPLIDSPAEITEFVLANADGSLAFLDHVLVHAQRGSSFVGSTFHDDRQDE